jgi:hypothetical protein
MGWTAGVLFQAGENDFFHKVLFIESFSGAKRPGRKTDRLPPFTTEIKNGGSITPLPHSSSWCGALTFFLPLFFVRRLQ